MRKMQAVVHKMPINMADEADDIFWAKTNMEFRLAELNKLRNFYKKFIGLASNARIEKVVNRIPIYEQDV